MYIEDLIHFLAKGVCQLFSRDERMIESFDYQNIQGIGLTEKQRTAAIKILKHYESSIAPFFGNISHLLNNPIYKLPVRVLKTIKKITIADHVTYGRIIKVEFPYNEDKVRIIRENRDRLALSSWDQEMKCWVFSLDEASIVFLTDFLEQENFDIDPEIVNYAAEAKKIIKNMESYVPMLVLENNLPKIINSPKNLPKLISSNVIEAVFECRKIGVLTWSEEIDNQLANANVSEQVIEFLSSDYDKKILIDSQFTSIKCLENIVQYMSPCLFVIPGGNEFEKMSMAYNFLNSIGIADKDMSVMFRLPSDEGGNFNNFVKDHKLNSPIGENTKVVFVGTKFPKSILKSKIKFNSIINLGMYSAHHTTQSFLENHENVVVFSEVSSKKERAVWQQLK